MEKFFKLKEHQTDVKTELIAGITSFMTMAYILAVNPKVLSAAGMDAGSVFTATAIASAIACIAMALLAHLQCDSTDLETRGVRGIRLVYYVYRFTECTRRCGRGNAGYSFFL